MSFILDALRKSEKQRQNTAAPGIADARVKTPSQSKGHWKWVVAALLLVNSVLLAVLWLRNESSDQPTVATASSATAASRSPAAGSRRLTNELPARNITADSVPTKTQTNEQSPIEKPKPTSALDKRAQLVTSQPERSKSDSSLPSMESLQLQGLITLPPQRIDLHVYSDIPSERFVFINMKKLREGSQLSDGPVISEVTPDGVIMTYSGYRFVLTKN